MKNTELWRQVEAIEIKSNTGPYGAWRRRFVPLYLKTLNQIRDEREQRLLATLKDRGETITCHEGCDNCCGQHIDAHLAHGLVIADYLYQNKRLLRKFMEDYDRWLEAVGTTAWKIDMIQNQAAAERLTFDQWWFLVNPWLTRYFQLAAPCPFLKDSACSIYPVRPECCASHYSVNPPERCSVSNEAGSPTYDLVLKEAEQQKLGALAPAELFIYQKTMPLLVHRLLTEGLQPMLAELGIKTLDLKP